MSGWCARGRLEGVTVVGTGVRVVVVDDCGGRGEGSGSGEEVVMVPRATVVVV